MVDRMNRREVVLALLAIGATPMTAQSQPAGKISRVGYLSVRSAPESRDEAVSRGLRELGYVEGKNIFLEARYAAGNSDRLREYAAELVRLNVDVIISAGPIATRAAKEATAAIPIVMAFDPDPVGSRFVASLSRPGGNITGYSTLAPELSGKQLELLKQVIPKLSRVAVLGNSTQPGNAQMLRELELAAGKLSVKIQYLNILAPAEIETAFQAARKERSDAVIMLVVGTAIISHRAKILDLVAKNRLPSVFTDEQYVEDGGLMAYGVSMPDLFRRAAQYVDKILKGAKPSELPIEQPTKFELVINLKTAKVLGLKIPQSILLRADRLIE
jgi:putative ABC transport system substrate-binding protein